MLAAEGFSSLPFPGSLAEQPWGLLRVMRALKHYASDYATWTRDKEKCPTEVSNRIHLVLAAIARGAR